MDVCHHHVVQDGNFEFRAYVRSGSDEHGDSPEQHFDV